MGQSRMWLIGRDIVFVLIGRTTASQFMEDMERRSNCTWQLHPSNRRLS